MPAEKTERWDALAAEAEAFGIEVDGRWSEATLEEKLRLAHHAGIGPARVEGEEVPPPEGAEVVETTVEATPEQKREARASVIAKLRAMGVYYSENMDDETLAAILDRKQREPMIETLARLGGHYNPDWTLDELREAMIEAGKPIEAPEGIDLIHASVKDPSQGEVIKSTSKRRHSLGDAAMQYIEHGQTALVPSDVAQAFRDAGLVE